MYCKKCGTKVVSEDSVFCRKCGAPLGIEDNKNALEQLKQQMVYKKDEPIKKLEENLLKSDSGAKARPSIEMKDSTQSKLLIVLGLVALIFVAILYVSSDSTNKTEGVSQEAKKHTQAETAHAKDSKGESANRSDTVANDSFVQAQKEREEKSLSDSAERVVREYIHALDINDFRKVYELMSPRKRNEVGSYDTWVKGFTQPESRITLHSAETISIDGDKVLVRYHITIKENQYKPSRDKTSVARVLRVGNKVTIDDINNQ